MSSVIGIVLLCRLLLSNQAVLAANADDRNQRTETAEEEDDHSNRRDQQRTVGGPIIGIDLGTTYSCVGVFRPGKAGVEIIPNDQGNRITPSYVAFVPPPPDGQQQQRQQRERRLVGDSAKNQAALNPENTIFDVKRLIGRRFSDPSVLRDRELVPYRIVAGGGGGGDGDDATDDDDDDRAHVLANGRAYAPEEISGMVLSKLRADAERYLGVPIDRAVVTVPAYFNDAQRHATRDAGVIAGLRVERVINEPTAAAMAYGLERRREDDDTGGGERIVLVFDLGGGTFDVTLLAIDDGVFEVLATNGDTHLGGSDVDRIVMEHFLETMARRDGRDDVAGDRRALQKLRREAERVKRALSSQLTARLELEDLLPGYDFSATLTRAKFEELNDALFRRTLGPVRKAMEDAALEVGEVDEIVLVGGSTRIPRVRKLVEDFFDGKGIEAGIDPDESVAAGAAIQGSVLSGEGGHDDARDLMLLDVAPLSLGTEVDGGLMRVLVKRGTTIPTETTMDFHTVHDRQTHMTIDVFEGERSRTEHNHLLGLFEMTDLPPAPRGEVEVRITFKVDANGMLEVTAANLATKSTKSITITAEDGRLSEEKIEAMVKEAERFAEEDAREAERIEARNQLESHLYRVSSSLNENEERIEDKDDLKTLMDSLDEMAEWLDGNQDAAETEFRQKYAEIDSLSKPVLQSLYEAGGEDRDGFDDEL